MTNDTLRKVKWTPVFDAALKVWWPKLPGERAGVQPVTLLEHLMRENFKPFGHTEVKNSAAYVTAVRKKNRKQSDEAFLAEIDAWQNSQSS
ncbi:hypothetical protein [Nitrospira sp. Nam80]